MTDSRRYGSAIVFAVVESVFLISKLTLSKSEGSGGALVVVPRRIFQSFEAVSSILASYGCGCLLKWLLLPMVVYFVWIKQSNQTVLSDSNHSIFRMNRNNLPLIITIISWIGNAGVSIILTRPRDNWCIVGKCYFVESNGFICEYKPCLRYFLSW